MYAEEMGDVPLDLNANNDISKQAAVPLVGYASLHVYTINGKALKSRMFTHRLNDLKCSSDGEFLVVADDRRGVLIINSRRYIFIYFNAYFIIIYYICSLQTFHRFDISVVVQSLAITDNQHFIFMGRADGKILLLSLDFRKLIK